MSGLWINSIGICSSGAIVGDGALNSGCLTYPADNRTVQLLENTMAERNVKTARLEARITPDLQALLKRAAELEGRFVTDFVITAAQGAAERRVEQAQVIRLSLEDLTSLRRSHSQPA
jgi:uncharacterized protein (DUF1778 family)